MYSMIGEGASSGLSKGNRDACPQRSGGGKMAQRVLLQILWILNIDVQIEQL